MKTYIFPLFSLFLILFSCSSNHEPTEQIISEEDSLQYVQEILADLKEEIYEHSSYDQIKIITSCYPPLNPVNYFVIDQTKEGKIIARKDTVDDIQKVLFSYLTANQFVDDPDGKNLEYHPITRNQVKYGIKNAKKEYEDALNTPDIAQDYIKFKKDQISAWEYKYLLFKHVDFDTILEPNHRAALEINYPDNAKFDLLDTILPVYLKLRNNAAERFFNTSYIRLHGDTTLQAKEKIIALKIAHPIVIVDIPYCEKNNFSNRLQYREVVIPPMPSVE